jgi:hypothetical protein
MNDQAICQNKKMARIHPTTPLHAPLTSGDFRERDVLRILRDGLPANFEVFHIEQVH